MNALMSAFDPKRFDEGQTIVRWIERYIPIPAGLPSPGAPLRLRDWQRDVVRRIYASRGKQIRDVLEGNDPTRHQAARTERPGRAKSMSDG